MARINYSSLIDKLKHCGFTEVTDSRIVNERHECGLLIRAQGNRDTFPYPFTSYDEVRYEKLVARIRRELHADGGVLPNYVAITNGGDTYRIEIYFTFVTFPSNDQTECERECPCGSFTFPPHA
jgi:hypothetical protein